MAYEDKTWREQGYEDIHNELKCVAWKLYDLTTDFKELQLEADELVPSLSCDKREYSRERISSKLSNHTDSKQEKATSDMRADRRVEETYDRRYRDMTTQELQEELKFRLWKMKEAKKHEQYTKQHNQCCCCCSISVPVVEKRRFSSPCRCYQAIPRCPNLYSGTRY